MLALVLAAMLHFSGYISSRQPAPGFPCSDTSGALEHVAGLSALGVTAEDQQWPFWKPLHAGWFDIAMIDLGYVHIDFSVLDSAGNPSCPVSWDRAAASVAIPPPDVRPIAPWRPGVYDVAGRRVDYMGRPPSGMFFDRDSFAVVRKRVRLQ